MADSVKISALPASTDAQMTDAGLIETAVADSSSSTGFTSKKSTLARLATYILNKFTGLSLAGSSQTVKSALDSLNSNKLALGVSPNAYITSGADLDSFKTPGVYDCSSATIARTLLHKPDAVETGFRLIVTQAGYGSFAYGLQIIIIGSGYSYPRMFKRALLGEASGNNWSAWDLSPTRAEMDAASAATTQTQLRNTDLNTLTEPMRFYYAGGTHGCTNVPANAPSFGLMVFQIAGSYRAQICIASGLGVYIRRYTGSEWSSWYEFSKSIIS